MGVSKIPSMGALTPIESLIKGGSAKDLFSPKNWVSDTMAVIQKPSTVLNAKYLTGQDDKGGKTLTSQAKEQEKNYDSGVRRDFANQYGNAEAFANSKKLTVGLKV
ncbi:MAG: hypothetical protein [Caudoviricetes sp.]|nr:MAG: hypothetical protein [Caudoviricetes sp.]